MRLNGYPSALLVCQQRGVLRANKQSESTRYNTRRSHMERGNLPPIRDVPDEVSTLTMDQIEVKSYVGGLVKSFERRAA
ncbi:MAG: hypothetical protein IID44_26500 [Planctomycetes bacterium]|nr:hypothetical protein [Planctomycetota bacterium]